MMPSFQFVTGIDPLTALIVAALGVALTVSGTLAWVCYRLLVDRGHLLLRLAQPGEPSPPRDLAGLPAGAILSDFALPALAGSAEIVTLSQLAGQSLLLIFVRPDCLFSRAAARELAGDQPGSGTPLPVIVISGDPDGPGDVAPFGGLSGPVLLDQDGVVTRLMRVRATPAGYLVDEGRRTIGPIVVGPGALLAAARGEPIAVDGSPYAVTAIPDPVAPPRPLVTGEEAPEFTLPTFGGEAWSLRHHLGRPLTLVFSDPACPPCAELLAALETWDLSSVVVVSRGRVEENRRLIDLSAAGATLLLQQNREVARAYRTLETPAAYALDATGAIVAGPAVGAEAVLALLGDNARVAASGAGATNDG